MYEQAGLYYYTKVFRITDIDGTEITDFLNSFTSNTHRVEGYVSVGNFIVITVSSQTERA